MAKFTNKSVAVKKGRASSRDSWNDAQTEALIGIYSKTYQAKNRGNLRPKDWSQVTATFNKWATESKNELKSHKQIQHKVENLKKKYRAEKDAQGAAGGTPSEWSWFSHLNDILGEDPKFCGVLKGELSPCIKEMLKVFANFAKEQAELNLKCQLEIAKLIVRADQGASSNSPL